MGLAGESPGKLKRRKLTPLEERFLKYGLKGFRDPEIIELILGHTLSSKECKKLMTKINKRYKTLRDFLSAPIKELEKIPEMSPRSILCVKLLREVPQAFLEEKIIDKPISKSSQEVFEYLYYSMRDLKKEVFKVVYLDNKNQIIDTEDLFEGTLDGIHIYPREIEEGAIKHEATGLIFVHNHTSGDCTPSLNDKQITRDLVFIGKVLNIKVLDHIVIGENRYYSFADAGLIAKYEDDFMNLRLRRFVLKGTGHKLSTTNRKAPHSVPLN
jgi:DNA repair protein RadC